MKVIAGLGNPGKKYIWTRHNLGFMLIDSLAEEKTPFQKKHKSLIQKTEVGGEQVLLVKPQTFMNLSGQAIQEIINFYKIPLDNLLVIHDDKDLAFGKIRLQKSRGHGGHNGIKSIHEKLSSKDYCRLKMGIAPSPAQKNRPSDKRQIPQDIDFKSGLGTSPDGPKLKTQPNTDQFVLSPFDNKERQKLTDFLERGIQAVHSFIQKGYEKTANQFNSSNQN